MGVPTSEVGYNPAMPRREDHEVHKDMWWHWTKRNISQPAVGYIGNSAEKLIEVAKNGSFGGPLHYPLLHNQVLTAQRRKFEHICSGNKSRQFFFGI